MTRFRMLPCALILLLVWGGGTIAGAAPRLKIEPKHADLGEIKQGTQVEQVFRYTNIGDTQLNIEQIKTSCGCTVASPSQSQLAPGESSELKAVFNSAGFSGNISKSIYIYTNDPTRFTEVTMKGRVIPELAVTPEMIDLGSIKPGITQTTEIAIKNNGKNPINVSQIEPLVRDVEIVSNQKTIPPGGTFRFTVKTTPSRNSSRISGYLIVHTDHATTPSLRIPVFAAIEE